MASSIQTLESKSFRQENFLDGKLSALHILFETYLELQIKGTHYVSLEELLNTIRTLILNLEKQGGSSP